MSNWERINWNSNRLTCASVLSYEFLICNIILARTNSCIILQKKHEDLKLERQRKRDEERKRRSRDRDRDRDDRKRDNDRRNNRSRYEFCLTTFFSKHSLLLIVN